MLIDDLNSIPGMFKAGFRVVMLLHRNKEGEFGNAQRKAFKRITQNEKEWDAAVDELARLQWLYPTHRLYASVNSRDINKAIHEFKLRQIECDYSNQYDAFRFYTDVETRFVSCLMKVSNKIQSNFLIACDTNEQYNAVIEQIPEHLILFQYATRSGRHIITKQFNTNNYNNIEVLKDGLMLIG
jgi:hypothetical protein